MAVWRGWLRMVPPEPQAVFFAELPPPQLLALSSSRVAEHLRAEASRSPTSAFDALAAERTARRHAR